METISAIKFTTITSFITDFALSVKHANQC